jgi:hypothetical protein
MYHPAMGRAYVDHAELVREVYVVVAAVFLLLLLLLLLLLCVLSCVAFCMLWRFMLKTYSINRGRLPCKECRQLYLG